MRKILILIALLTIATVARGQQSSLIQNVSARSPINLDGQWKVIIDPYETGSSNNGFFNDAQPKSKSDFVEYSFDTSESLSVPGDWNTQRERLFFYEGAVWYKKSFDYQRQANSRLSVYFGAANYLADVYLNGAKVGRHEGGFTPFNFEITNLVRILQTTSGRACVKTWWNLRRRRWPVAAQAGVPARAARVRWGPLNKQSNSEGVRWKSAKLANSPNTFGVICSEFSHSLGRGMLPSSALD